MPSALSRLACLASLVSACSATPPALQAPASAPQTPAPTASPTFCAAVDIGLDLRALPAPASDASIDVFVRGEAQDLLGAAPGDPPPRIFTTPGIGALIAQYEAPTDEAARARCDQSVAAYLKNSAPVVPITMTPAARVTAPCRPCEGTPPPT